LRLAFHTTLNKNRPLGSVASSEHIDAARKIGEEGIVLFKIKIPLYQLI
jgi:beta-glucosidase